MVVTVVRALLLNGVVFLCWLASTALSSFNWTGVLVLFCAPCDERDNCQNCQNCYDVFHFNLLYETKAKRLRLYLLWSGHLELNQDYNAPDVIGYHTPPTLFKDGN